MQAQTNSKEQFCGFDIKTLQTYTPKFKLRFITSTSLFDGHDASINIMRRLVQQRGGEVIHLGHNRSAHDIVQAALQEDAHAVAISSYQGGHLEFFRYIRKLLNEGGGQNIKIFGGGGGVIVPEEIAALEKEGITKIFSPEDGQLIGLSGIIGYMLAASDVEFKDKIKNTNPFRTLARDLSLLENELELNSKKDYVKSKTTTPVVGITGTGGAGKSSLTDELLQRFLFDTKDLKIGVICVDPSKKKTGGALLGDRIRMNSSSHSRIFLRSFATRGSNQEISIVTKAALEMVKDSKLFDLIFLETSGIGQGNSAVLELCNISLYVMTAEYGASSQLEKIDMLDFADFIAINKFERSQALDAIREVRTVLRRSRFQGERKSIEEFPVYGTIASRFNDDGVNGLYSALVTKINSFVGKEIVTVNSQRPKALESTQRNSIIPGDKAHYLSNIAKSVRAYHQETKKILEHVKIWQACEDLLKDKTLDPTIKSNLETKLEKAKDQVSRELRAELESWENISKKYDQDIYSYEIRGKEVKAKARFETLSHLDLPKVALPLFSSKADLLKYIREENRPGYFPYTASVFPFRRAGEDPKRQFAGEGGPIRTNTRFHFLSKNDETKRLSTAFDSVTLYGADPHERPDIYGKVGESGVSIATLNDMKDLYKGFDLSAPQTSVSMTINGPAPMILAMFLNTAIDQNIDSFVQKNKRAPSSEEHQKIYDQTLNIVRGTVQADILKEDQAQNTCIFSTEFALKLMGDIQEYFIDKKVRNYYSVSISGYHIAEAGANPITQTAFTLSNGFTYVEYYLSRGMLIDDFAPNLSFFFSNGIDAEYSVIGRVARRIWAIAMRDLYLANDRSQKLKYHIQTSGRSLHAQEIDFNDIRTTLQALLALYDNCNSLHTNAYDEAITTPTEESVRRAMAIQMIINNEFGPNKCENINQGSFFLTRLTDLVEEAVLQEFERLDQRGGTLGAMETQYQRSKIQEESLYYETLKDSGELPIIGVNTFKNPKVLSGEYERPKIELIRSTYEEKNEQISRLQAFQKTNESKCEEALKKLEEAVITRRNIFAELMHTVRHASLGQITETLYRVGGQYRRAM